MHPLPLRPDTAGLCHICTRCLGPACVCSEPPTQDLLIFIIHVWTFCLHICLCIMVMPGVCRAQKRALDPWKLESWTAMSHHVDAGNWTPSRVKDKCCELLSHLSSPCKVLLITVNFLYWLEGVLYVTYNIHQTVLQMHLHFCKLQLMISLIAYICFPHI